MRTPIVNPESDSVIKILVNQYFLSHSSASLLRPSNTHNTELMKSVSQERGCWVLGQAGLGRCQMTSYVNLIVLMRMLFTRS